MTISDIDQAKKAYLQFNQLTGLELMRKLMRDGDQSPMAQTMGLRPIFVSDGEVKIAAMPLPKFYNPMMRIHGGFTATLIDNCMGSAVLTKLPAATGVGTVVLNVNYVRKIELETGELIATGTVLHTGRTMLTAEAKVTDASGKLYAHGTGTFLVYPKSDF
jgi:acyl-CoA thioesterase